MLKYITLLAILSLFFPEKSDGQIVNGGFEEWEEVEGYLKPVGWQIPNVIFNEGYQYLVRDTISVEGDYSLKVIATPSLFTCETDFNPIQTIPTYGLGENISIVMSIKSLTDSFNTSGDTYLQFFGSVYKNDSVAGAFNWVETGIIEDFTEIEIPIEVVNPDSLLLYVTGGASPVPIFVDGCHSFTMSWIDNIRIVERVITGVDDRHNNTERSIICFPNPSNGQVSVKQKDALYESVYIYDVLGNLVLTQKIEQTLTLINIATEGVYFFKFTNNSETSSPALMRVIIN